MAMGSSERRKEIEGGREGGRELKNINTLLSPFSLSSRVTVSEALNFITV